jgi:hypothetical protein
MKNTSFECGLIKLGKIAESVQQNKPIHNGVQVVLSLGWGIKVIQEVVSTWEDTSDKRMQLN